MTTPDHDAASPAPTLPELRDRIDALDRELIAMLNRRARLAQEVGEIKKREGSVVFRPEREAQVIDGLKQFNPGPLKNESVAPTSSSLIAPSVCCPAASSSNSSTTTAASAASRRVAHAAR